MTNRVEHLAEGVMLYLGDCRDILPTLGTIDAIVTDPPYGLGEKWQGGKAKWPLHHQDGMKWDAELVSSVNDLPTLARHVIIWGGHLYDLPAKPGWLVWDKIVRNFTSGVMEFAWSSLDQPIKAMNYSHGELASEGKVHPTQKPVPLMKWCIQQLPSDCMMIVDPFMGSGTTGVAAVMLGKKFTGIEQDPRYFEIACKRIKAAIDAPDMFVERPKPARQEALL